MAVCAAKVRLALEEKSLPWQGVHMNLRAGDALRPEYLALNPNGVVPTLVDGGEVIIESTVICEYLDDAYPDRPLKPRAALSRAAMRQWTLGLDQWVHAAVATISFCIAFRHQLLKKSAEDLEAHLAKVPSKERRERQRENILHGMDSPNFLHEIRRIKTLLGGMEKALADGPWLCGKDYSLADIGYTPYVLRLEHLGLDSLYAGCPRVAAWLETIKQRTNYEPAVGAWLNPDYLRIFAQNRDEAADKLKQLAAI